mmetsp:Transcript_15319/g.28611  ORF Transcript_15319/g.28611 Transcript_15319/m.28611 type:complete len:308 (-) Transcript_15319:2474-3397(-)
MWVFSAGASSPPPVCTMTSRPGPSPVFFFISLLVYAKRFLNRNRSNLEVESMFRKRLSISLLASPGRSAASLSKGPPSPSAPLLPLLPASTLMVAKTLNCDRVLGEPSGASFASSSKAASTRTVTSGSRLSKLTADSSNRSDIKLCPSMSPPLPSTAALLICRILFPLCVTTTSTSLSGPLAFSASASPLINLRCFAPFHQTCNVIAAATWTRSMSRSSSSPSTFASPSASMLIPIVSFKLLRAFSACLNCLWRHNLEISPAKPLTSSLPFKSLSLMNAPFKPSSSESSKTMRPKGSILTSSWGCSS